MALPWGLLIVLIGMVWGLAAPEGHRRLRLLWNGLLVGATLGLVFALLGYTMETNPLGVGTAVWTFVAAFFVLLLLFTFGAWVGDVIEGSARRRPV